MRRLNLPSAVAILLLISAFSAGAQTTLTTPAVADTFVGTNGPGYTNTGSNNTDVPNGNYGAAGAMQLSAAGSNRGERQSVFRFDLASTVAGFNTQYGAGNWTLASVSLRLTSNFSIQGQQPNNNIFNAINSGLFDIRWMTDDTWIEGNGTPNSVNNVSGALTNTNLAGFLAAGDTSLGVQSFVATATATPLAAYALGLQTGFVTDVSAGGLVSLHMLAADGSVSYLFNTITQGNPPVLLVTAIPEPGSLALLAGAGLLAAVCSRWRWT